MRGAAAVFGRRASGAKPGAASGCRNSILELMGVYNYNCRVLRRCGAKSKPGARGSGFTGPSSENPNQTADLCAVWVRPVQRAQYPLIKEYTLNHNIKTPVI